MHAESLVAPLMNLGYEASLELADWIPDQTGPTADRPVSERLRAVGQSCDVVHAFGYRAAWACAEAYGGREAWVYSALDLPKSTHRFLMTRLNDAQAGICASRAIYRALDENLGMNLHTISPGIAMEPDADEDPPVSKSEWGIPEGAKVAGCWIPQGQEAQAQLIVQSMHDVWIAHPDVRLALAGHQETILAALGDSAELDTRLIVAAGVSRPRFLAGLDLFIVPESRAGFSLVAIEAMSKGAPVMVRNSGGLPEIIEPDVSGFLFDDDDSLGSSAAEVLGLDLTLETVGRGGRIRALERFTIERSAKLVAEIYDLAICP
jgi:hypothetical protein